MWDTSNRPARVLTARCSLTMPEYSTGISHPPNGTMRAPCARCLAFNGVFLSCSAEGWVMEARGGDPSRQGTMRAPPGQAPDQNEGRVMPSFCIFDCSV